MISKTFAVIRKRPLAFIVIFAGMVRLIFLLTYYWDPEWNQLLVDSLFHDNWANSIAGGDIVGQDVFFRAPLYIYILAAIYSIFGHSILAARIFGHICGLISVYTTGRIAGRLFGNRAGIIAALIHALYPISIYFESELLVDNLFTMLVELSVLFFLYATSLRNRKYILLTGLALGLAAITRPLILAMVPLYMIWIVMSYANLKKSIAANLILLGSLIIMVLPVTIRNLIVADDFALVSSSGGINFYLGNNASADGFSASMPPPYGHNWQIKDINYLAESEAGRDLKASEISRFWIDKGLEWIEANRSEFLKLYLYKIYLAFNNLEISNNRNLNLFFKKNPILRIDPLNFSLILTLAFLGLFILMADKKLWPWPAFIFVFILAYVLVISLFFINSRFRLPIVPLLIIIASYGLGAIIDAVTNRKYHPKYLLAVFISIVIFWASARSVPGIDSTDISSGLYNQANYHLYKNDLGRAIDLYKQLLEKYPGYPDANLNLGAAYLKQGNGDSAEYYFHKEVEYYPNRPDGYANLASLYYLEGKYQPALNNVDRALSIKPYFGDASLIKLRVLAALKDTVNLRQAVNEALRNTGDTGRIGFEAGIIYSNWQMFNVAVPYLMTALNANMVAAETDDRSFGYTGITGQQQIKRTKGRAAYQLGYIYGSQNNLSRSIEMSSLAISYDSNQVDAYVNLINGYRLTGQLDSARAILRIARKRFPDYAPVRSLQQLLK